MNRKRFLTEEQISGTLEAVTKLAVERKIKFALIGGAAMGYYGSPRLTVDLDVVADGLPVEATGRVLTFGGQAQTVNGVEVDWVTREDDYAQLYAEALAAATLAENCAYRVVTSEYLAAMKLAAGRTKDYDDLLWLLQQKSLVDRSKARSIIRRLLGGKFAVDEFNQAALEADFRQERG